MLTSHKLTRSEGVPAYKNALVRPISSSPLLTVALPDEHALNVIILALSEILNISLAGRKY